MEGNKNALLLRLLTCQQSRYRSDNKNEPHLEGKIRQSAWKNEAPTPVPSLSGGRQEKERCADGAPAALEAGAEEPQIKEERSGLEERGWEALGSLSVMTHYTCKGE